MVDSSNIARTHFSDHGLICHLYLGIMIARTLHLREVKSHDSLCVRFYFFLHRCSYKITYSYVFFQVWSRIYASKHLMCPMPRQQENTIIGFQRICETFIYRKSGPSVNSVRYFSSKNWYVQFKGKFQERMSAYYLMHHIFLKNRNHTTFNCSNHFPVEKPVPCCDLATYNYPSARKFLVKGLFRLDTMTQKLKE